MTFATSNGGRTLFGPFLGADFGASYVAGKIFNTQKPDQIYDRVLHHQIYDAEFPEADPDTQSPYVNAPFFILPFTVLARLPYSWAYLAWVAISLILYLAGCSLIWKTLDAIPRDARSLTLLLSLSFMPFLVECLAGGQTSAVGFFFIALAITLERRRRYFLSGLALAVCAYKPTLLLLIAPMLLVTRRYLTILGSAVGGASLALISSLLVGKQGCLAYLNVLLFFKEASTSSVSGLLSWKYVDVNSFFRLLLGGQPQLRWLMTAAAFLVGLPFLFRAWWRNAGEREAERTSVWAVTITATLVLNLYLGIYDSTLVVLSVLVTTDLLYRRAGTTHFQFPPVYQFLLVLLYVVPWITQPLARLTHVQTFTLVLAFLGAWQLKQLNVPRAKEID